MKKVVNKKTAGQTIVEVLIATAVVGLVLTAIAAGLTYSVKNSAEAKYREVATTKSQEVVEVFRRERSNLGWESFTELMAPGTTHCFNTLPASTQAFATTLATPTDCSEGVAETGTEFTREVGILSANDDEVVIEVVTSWYDGADVRQVTVTQELRQFTL